MASKLFRTRNYFYDPCLSFLAREGYFLGRKLGEGKHKEVYDAFYCKRNSLIQQRRVVKIPIQGVQSIQGRINLSKGDPNLREIERLVSLSHQNIIRIYDFLSWKNSAIIVEEFFDAQNLEQYVERWGPIYNQDKFSHFFRQAIDALGYLHLQRSLLHRDIKPSNLLVGEIDGIIKLIDFQFATGIEDAISKVLPTRGGTQFTTPIMLKDLLDGKANSSTISTDLYALGATMYYAITGEHLFDFSLVEDKEGRIIEIDGEEVRIAVDTKRERLCQIDLGECLVEIHQKLDKLPRHFRSLLVDFLDFKKNVYSGNAKKVYQHLRENFEEIFSRGNPTFEADLAVFSEKKQKELLQSLKPKIIDSEVPISDYLEQTHNGSTTIHHSNGESVFVYGSQDHLDLILSSIIQVATKLPQNLGNWSLEESQIKEYGKGSDAVRQASGRETYIFEIKSEDVDVIVSNKTDTLRYGTRSPGWNNSYERELTIRSKGEKIFKARKNMGGSVGNLNRQDEKLAGSWEVRKSAPLEKVVKCLEQLHGIIGKDKISIPM